MKVWQIEKMEEELFRFGSALDAVKARMGEQDDISNTKETGALRRASLDLSRVLAEHRQNWSGWKSGVDYDE